MGYYYEILEQTAKAVNACYERKVMTVSVRRVRRCYSLDSTNRSKIVFISRALDELSKDGYLRFAGRSSPKRYEIVRPVDEEYLNAKREQLAG
ncbi:MAG: hypothetical protein Kow0069_06690 [Promethearchaeota archaeon]